MPFNTGPFVIFKYNCQGESLDLVTDIALLGFLLHTVKFHLLKKKLCIYRLLLIHLFIKGVLNIYHIETMPSFCLQVLDLKILQSQNHIKSSMNICLNIWGIIKGIPLSLERFLPHFCYHLNILNCMVN